MTIHDKIKTEHAEMIIRFLAEEENYGQKFTPHTISTKLAEKNIKTYGTKVEKDLAMLTLACGEIFGYEETLTYSFYWIAVDKAKFTEWFKDWFGKEF